MFSAFFTHVDIYRSWPLFFFLFRSFLFVVSFALPHVSNKEHNLPIFCFVLFFIPFQEIGTSNVVRTGVAAGDMKAAVEAVAAGGGLTAVASEEGGKKSEEDGGKGGEERGDDGESKDGGGDNDEDDDTPPREFFFQRSRFFSRM